MEIDLCKNINPENFNFIVLQLNTRSILSNQEKLRMLLNDLNNRGSNLMQVILTGKKDELRDSEQVSPFKSYYNFLLLHLDNTEIIRNEHKCYPHA